MLSKIKIEISLKFSQSAISGTISIIYRDYEHKLNYKQTQSESKFALKQMPRIQ